LIGVILLMDAQYLEAAAISSERFYAKIEQMRKGGPSISSFGKNKKWKGLPSLPWLGGAGPVAWRQLTCATRDFARGLVPVLASLSLAILGIVIATLSGGVDTEPIALGLGAAIVGLALVLTNLLTFDFRGDYERMEGLKTLPIGSSRLVLGQLATPCGVLAGSQILALALLGYGAGPVPPAYWAYIAFVPLLDLLMLEIDNLMFLLFPSKPMSHTPGDVQAMGRMMVMMIAKMIALGITLGLAVGFGFVAYLAGGAIAAGVVAWLIMAAMIAGFVPLVALAFDRFDVASDTPS